MRAGRSWQGERGKQFETSERAQGVGGGTGQRFNHSRGMCHGERCDQSPPSFRSRSQQAHATCEEAWQQPSIAHWHGSV